MKVRFTCCNCRESFNVDAENFENKSSLVCPNCGSEFPSDKLKILGDAVLKIEQVKKPLFKKGRLADDVPTWTISILDSTGEHY
ncbi:hypothetical protein AB8U03_17875 [Clostridium sp. Mt-5]|uniref:Uncharacterized protein n=1 Tax=Clostridium moutaii TaxID=3240932 RepID=A0ABV4BUX2_9CLOT